MATGMVLIITPAKAGPTGPRTGGHVHVRNDATPASCLTAELYHIPRYRTSQDAAQATRFAPSEPNRASVVPAVQAHRRHTSRPSDCDSTQASCHNTPEEESAR